MADQLVIRGAREHNLKDISLDLPRDRLIVLTGLSGSGKSSLAFDTIYAEGQRRYVESLSAYARQFLGQMDKPDVDFIEGLSPAISIDQKSASRNPRSTVGHHHRDLRLPAPALRPHRRAPLPEGRHGRQPPDAPADRGPHPGAARGHPLPGPGPRGARAQGHLRHPPGRPGHPGLRPRPHGRRGPGAGRPGGPGGRAGPLRDAHHRGRGRPPRPAGGHRAPPHRLAGDRPATGRRHGRDRAGAPRRGGPRRRGAGGPDLQPAPGLPHLRDVLRRARPPQLLVQLALRRLHQLRRPRDQVRGRPRAGGPQPRPHPRRRRHRAMGQRAQPVLQAPHRGRGRRQRHPGRSALAGAAREGPQAAAERGRRPAGPRQVQEPLRPVPQLPRQVRGRGPVPAAPPRRSRVRCGA